MMDLNYPMIIYCEKNGESNDWVVEFPDLKGCVGVGSTKEEALKDAEIAKKLWIESVIEDGDNFPAPSNKYAISYSGKFNLRIAKSLHRDLALFADDEGVSLNTLCSKYLAEGLERSRKDFSQPSPFTPVESSSWTLNFAQHTRKFKKNTPCA